MHSGLARCVQIPKLNGSHQGVMVIWCEIHLVTYSNRKKIEPFKRDRSFHFCQQFPVLWKSISISERKQGIFSDNNPLNTGRSQNQNTVSSETLTKQRKSPYGGALVTYWNCFWEWRIQIGFCQAAISEELVVCLSKCLFTLSFDSVFARDILKFQFDNCFKNIMCKYS